jgi:3-dehydroquinate synthase
MQSLIPVNLPQESYNISIASGSLEGLGNLTRELNLGKKVLLVSNPEIWQYYGEKALISLQKAGFEVLRHLIPAGESYKTLESIAKIYDTALENHLERSSVAIALGGGVVGDMTGFAAATWLRGINFIQVPTSLLAMVDAAIGGKTGVNHPKGKNLIGAFYQPRLVLIDPQVLETLPKREFRAGMAEVIKYGVIWDADMFEQLEKAERLDRFSDLDEALLQTILTRSCQAKADVVSKDEKEAGLRAILNYGHTVGHAIESLTGYSSINHGEAVAIGMAIAGEIAARMQLWDALDARRQDRLIAKAGLPTKLPANLDIEAIIEVLQTDKKVKDGRVRFVLPTKLGAAIVSDRVLPELLREVLNQFKQ